MNHHTQHPAIIHQPIRNQDEMAYLVSSNSGLELLPLLRQMAGKLLSSSVAAVTLNPAQETISVIHSGMYREDLEKIARYVKTSQPEEPNKEAAIEQCRVYYFDYKIWEEVEQSKHEIDLGQSKDIGDCQLIEVACRICMDINVAISLDLVTPENYATWLRLKTTQTDEYEIHLTKAIQDTLVEFSQNLTESLHPSLTEKLLSSLKRKFMTMSAFGVEPEAESYWEELGAVCQNNHPLMSIAITEIKKEVKKALDAMPLEQRVSMYLSHHSEENIGELLWSLISITGSGPTLDDLDRLPYAELIEELAHQIVSQAALNHSEKTKP